MRTQTLIGVISFACISFCEGQSKEQIRFIESYFSKSEKLIYTKGLSKFEIEYILKPLAKDTIFSLAYKYGPADDLLVLSREDKKEIDEKLDSLEINDWYNNLHLENSQIISQDSIEAMFNNNLAIGWEHFHKKYGLKLHRFSKPILFRNNTFCLFYYSYACSPFCGEGSLMLFRKEKGSWIKWLTLSNWVS